MRVLNQQSQTQSQRCRSFCAICSICFWLYFPRMFVFSRLTVGKPDTHFHFQRPKSALTKSLASSCRMWCSSIDFSRNGFPPSNQTEHLFLSDCTCMILGKVEFLRCHANYLHSSQNTIFFLYVTNCVYCLIFFARVCFFEHAFSWSIQQVQPKAEDIKNYYSPKCNVVDDSGASRLHADAGSDIRVYSYTGFQSNRVQAFCPFPLPQPAHSNVYLHVCRGACCDRSSPRYGALPIGVKTGVILLAISPVAITARHSMLALGGPPGYVDCL